MKFENSYRFIIIQAMIKVFYLKTNLVKNKGFKTD